MHKNVFAAVAVVTTILLQTVSFAEEKHHHKQHETNGKAISLPSDLRALILEEMRAIKKGMEEMVGAIATGNNHKVAMIAEKIEKSFIIKQKISKKQLTELHGSLPQGFRELDAKFHKNAGMLSHVAKAGHSDMISFYYYKLLEGCQQCHGKYANKRFSGFKESKGHDHGH